MKLQTINVRDLVAGDYIKYISLTKIVSVSESTFIRGFGFDEHYYKAECVKVVTESVYDYDIEYATENGLEVVPRRYEHDIPIESNLMKVLSGETICITSCTGEWNPETSEYIKKVLDTI